MKTYVFQVAKMNFHIKSMIILIILQFIFCGCASNSRKNLDINNSGMSLTYIERDSVYGTKITLIPSINGSGPYKDAYRRIKRMKRISDYYDAKRTEVEFCIMDAREGRPFTSRLGQFFHECKNAYESELLYMQERDYRNWERVERRKGRLQALKDINGYSR